MVDDFDFARHRLASMEELGTLQNLGRDDLEVFSTISIPGGVLLAPPNPLADKDE